MDLRCGAGRPGPECSGGFRISCGSVGRPQQTVVPDNRIVARSTARQLGVDMKKPAREESASTRIDERIETLGDWRGQTLARVRKIIRDADPDVVEEWKWAKATSPGTPVWSHDGIICTGETYKSAVKMTFAKGASLEDPSGLFNASLEGNVRRAIDIHEGDEIADEALKALIRAAVTLNESKARS